MSFAAGYGKTNVDLLFQCMPRLPLEGEEIVTDKFSLCLGGGVPGTMVTLSRLGVKTKNVTELSSEMFSQFALDEFKKAGNEPPASMMAVYEYLHERHIEKLAEARSYQDLYKTR